jgi:hypothetical protein
MLATRAPPSGGVFVSDPQASRSIFSARVATLSQRCPQAPVASGRFTESYKSGVTARLWPVSDRRPLTS